MGHNRAGERRKLRLRRRRKLQTTFNQERLFLSTGKLSAAILVDSVIQNEVQKRKMRPQTAAIIAMQSKRILEHVRFFEEKAWFGGLQAFLDKNPGNHQGSFGQFTIKLKEVAGRMLIVLAGQQAKIVLCCDRSNSKSSMGVVELDATSDQACSLVDWCNIHWKEAKFVPYS